MSYQNPSLALFRAIMAGEFFKFSLQLSAVRYQHSAGGWFAGFLIADSYWLIAHNSLIQAIKKGGEAPTFSFLLKQDLFQAGN